MNVEVMRNVFARNDALAADTRALLTQYGIVSVNLIGGAGAGKTTLLEATLPKLAGRKRTAVLEGDIATTHDAERIAALGVPAMQLLTDGGCHLGAALVYNSIQKLPLAELDLVFIENVGNLVCPANFDLGEQRTVAVLSTAEGDDKPAKYPLLFKRANAVVLTKLDLLPHVSFDVEQCIRYIRQLNEAAPIFALSAKTGDSLDDWVTWLLSA
ncbi:MAG: hydrogenase nickel incorporation protein HypB [Phycisphaerae bacterium]|nr:hydrogenase nickel incorporation protein HypB [Phycisphaerae bacterium]